MDIIKNYVKNFIFFHNEIVTKATAYFFSSVKDKEILNEGGLRNEKEFVNHKILDCIGDLYTSGFRLVANIKCSQGGHYLTNQLLRKLFENKENFSIIEIKEQSLPHNLINKSILKSIA